MVGEVWPGAGQGRVGHHAENDGLVLDLVHRGLQGRGGGYEEKVVVFGHGGIEHRGQVDDLALGVHDFKLVVAAADEPEPAQLLHKSLLAVLGKH